MAADDTVQVDLSANRGSYINIAVSVTLPLAIIGTALRFFARYIQKRNIDKSDWTILAGTILDIFLASLVYESVKAGLGRHYEAVDLDSMETFLKLFFASEIIYITTLCLVKFSILFLYCSIFPGKKFALIAKVIAVAVLLWALATIPLVIFSCLPVNAFWDRRLSPISKCVNPVSSFVGNAVPNIITDVIILALPLRKVWGLQISARQKILVTGIFFCGGFAIVASVLRLAFIDCPRKSDSTWCMVTIVAWSLIETNVAILTASLPTLRPIYTRFFSKSSDNLKEKRFINDSDSDMESASRDDNVQASGGFRPNTVSTPILRGSERENEVRVSPGSVVYSETITEYTKPLPPLPLPG